MLCHSFGETRRLHGEFPARIRELRLNSSWARMAARNLNYRAHDYHRWPSTAALNEGSEFGVLGASVNRERGNPAASRPRGTSPQ